MRKPFIKILIILLLLGVFIPQTTIAQSPADIGECIFVEDGITKRETMTRAECDRKFGGFIDGETRREVNNSSATGVINDSDNPGFWAYVFENLFYYVGTLLLKFTSFLTGLSAILLNGVIYHTVVRMAGNYAEIESISTTWRAVRDIANMAFIFVLLYAAINTILGRGGDNKKLIVNVVAMAVLINFSLFFTKLVIDVSNLLALTLYDAIAPGALAPDASWTEQKGLSNAFMQYLNLQSLYQGAQLTAGTSSLLAIGVMGSIMMLIAAFSFLAIAILFIIRYAVLILVLVLSPIYFVAQLLPGTEISGYAKRWSEALLGQAFFAPIYFLMTWVTLSLLGGITQSFGIKASTDLANQTTGLGAIGTVVDGTLNSGAFMMLINYIIVIALMLATLTVAKQWASKGGIGVTNWATDLAGKAAFGVAGAVGRRTIGAAASRLAQSERFQNFAGKNVIGQFALNRTNQMARSSFDFRNTRAGRATVGTLGAGQGQTGGFEATLQKKIEGRERFASTLRSNDAKEAYAKRIAGGNSAISGPFTRGGSRSSWNTMFGVLGRHNRVVASKILSDRIAKIQSDINSGNTELTRYQNIIRGGGTLNPTQQTRHDLLNGSPTTPGSLQHMRDQVDKLKTQINDLGLNNPKNTSLGRPIRADEQKF